jgi:hypothetical protein
MENRHLELRIFAKEISNNHLNSIIMKKLMLIAAGALLIATTANSQDVYKQSGGEQNLEVQFSPLGGSPIGINGIRYRKFTDAQTALRAEVFLGFSNSSDKMIGEDGETELTMSSSAFDISIAPGIEKHFASSDRLSPYVGGVVAIGFSSENEKEEFLSGPDNDVEEGTIKDGSLFFGVNGVAGCDFYFAHNIYLGVELGFGVGFETMFDTKRESTVEGSETIETPNGSSFNIGPNVNGAIRAGFLF